MSETLTVINICVIGAIEDVESALIQALEREFEDVNTPIFYTESEEERNHFIFNTVLSITSEGVKYNFTFTPYHLAFRNKIIDALEISDLVFWCIGTQFSQDFKSKYLLSLISQQAIQCHFISKTNNQNSDEDDFLISEIKEFTDAAVFPLRYSDNQKKDALWLKKETEFVDFSDAQQEAVESVVARDEELMNSYLEGNKIQRKKFVSGFRKCISQNEVYIYCSMGTSKEESLGSFLKNASYLSNHYRNENRKYSEFLVFQCVDIKDKGKFQFAKCKSRSLSSAQEMIIQRNKKIFQLPQLYTIQGSEIQSAEKGNENDIFLIKYSESLKTYDILSSGKSSDKTWNRESLSNLYRSKLVDPTENEEDEFSEAIRLMRNEFPNVSMERDHDIDQMIITFSEEAQAHIISDRLGKKFDIDFILDVPEYKKREKIIAATESHVIIESDSGKGGQYAEVVFLVEPYFANQKVNREYVWKNEDKLPWGGTLQLIWSVKTNQISNYYVKPVKQGIIDTMKKGFQTDYPVESLRVTVVGGSMHSTDSTHHAFEMAAGKAIKKALKSAGTQILEPYEKYHLGLPGSESHIVYSLVDSFNAVMEESESTKNEFHISLRLPMDQANRFLEQIFRKGSGRILFEREFAGYY